MRGNGMAAAFMAMVLAASYPNHHGTERGVAIHPADHRCEASSLRPGMYAQVTEGLFTGFTVKILDLHPSGTRHCHALVGFLEPHIDVLSVIGVLEIEMLAEMPK